MISSGLNDRKRDADVDCFALLNRHRNQENGNGIVTCEKTYIHPLQQSQTHVLADTARIECLKYKQTPRMVIIITSSYKRSSNYCRCILSGITNNENEARNPLLPIVHFCRFRTKKWHYTPHDFQAIQAGNSTLQNVLNKVVPSRRFLPYRYKQIAITIAIGPLMAWVTSG